MNKEIHNYYFVFSESIESTNVQFNELHSIIKTIKPDLINFRSISSHKILHEEPKIQNSIIESRFKQSCIINTYENPLFLKKIIERSSYIHSCGNLIFFSQMDEANIGKINEAIIKYLKHNQIGSIELSFFTQDHFSHMKNLNGLQIDQKRTFFQDIQFEKAYKVLQSYWEGRFSKDYKNNNYARIWFVKDIAENLENCSSWVYPEKYDDIYLIIYQPLYRKKNPLYELDEMREAKPYWRGIDTTPQRLMGAMLNLAQVDDGMTILEPFAYTGTLVLEALRYKLKNIYYGDKFESIGTKDNIDFISDNPENIIESVNKMQEILVRKKGMKSNPSCAEIRDLAQSTIEWKEGDPYPQLNNVKDLMKENMWLSNNEKRLFFYLVRRFFIENRIGYSSLNGSEKNKTFGPYERKPDGDLLSVFDHYIQDMLVLLQTYAEKRKQGNTLEKNRGLYDIGYEIIFAKENGNLINMGDLNIAKNDMNIRRNSVDAVITDPPYGYGSTEDIEKMRILYKKFFMESFKLLKSGGRIVMCVLDKVRTGKNVLPELMTEGVVDLANTIAKEQKISFITDSLRPFIGDDLLLSYWKAKHKLNRGILSFQIYKKMT